MFSRRCYLSFAALASLGAFAQSRAASAIGTVEKVSGNVVYVNTGAGLLTLSTDSRTEVWKGKTFHDLSPVATGDHVTARYTEDASGRLVADALWLNITNFSAIITNVTGATFEVLTNPNADPQSAYKKENKTIRVDSGTTFDASAQEDLKIGRNVQVVGVVLENGEIQATRVTVYNGNKPVRMPSDAVVRQANGSFR